MPWPYHSSENKTVFAQASHHAGNAGNYNPQEPEKEHSEYSGEGHHNSENHNDLRPEKDATRDSRYWAHSLMKTERTSTPQPLKHNATLLSDEGGHHHGHIDNNAGKHIKGSYWARGVLRKVEEGSLTPSASNSAPNMQPHLKSTATKHPINSSTKSPYSQNKKNESRNQRPRSISTTSMPGKGSSTVHHRKVRFEFPENPDDQDVNGTATSSHPEERSSRPSERGNKSAEYPPNSEEKPSAMFSDFPLFSDEELDKAWSEQGQRSGTSGSFFPTSKVLSCSKPGCPGSECDHVPVSGSSN